MSRKYLGLQTPSFRRRNNRTRFFSGAILPSSAHFHHSFIIRLWYAVAKRPGHSRSRNTTSVKNVHVHGRVARAVRASREVADRTAVYVPPVPLALPGLCSLPKKIPGKTVTFQLLRESPEHSGEKRDFVKTKIIKQ